MCVSTYLHAALQGNKYLLEFTGVTAPLLLRVTEKSICSKVESRSTLLARDKMQHYSLLFFSFSLFLSFSFFFLFFFNFLDINREREKERERKWQDTTIKVIIKKRPSGKSRWARMYRSFD